MRKWQNIDFPRVAKIMLIIITTIECGLYLYVGFQFTDSTTAIILTSCLILTSLWGILLSVISLVRRVYIYHPCVFMTVGVVCVASRFLSMIVIARLNTSYYDDFYMSEHTFTYLLRTALLFLAIGGILIYEKCHY
jgi:hypothetical protein